MSKLRAAVRVEAERSSISAIAGPGRQLSQCQFVAPTLQLLMATSVRSACHLHSCLLLPSLFLPSLMFKYSLQLWWGCFFVHYSSSGTECFTVLRWERDGVPCEGNYPNAQAEVRAGRRAFCRSGLCIFSHERCVSGERSACFSFLSRLFSGVRCTYGYHVGSERCSQPVANDRLAANMHERTHQLPFRVVRLF